MGGKKVSTYYYVLSIHHGKSDSLKHLELIIHKWVEVRIYLKVLKCISKTKKISALFFNNTKSFT